MAFRVMMVVAVFAGIVAGCSPSDRQDEREAWRLYSEGTTVAAAMNGLLAGDLPEYDTNAMTEEDLGGLTGAERRIYLNDAADKLDRALHLNPELVQAWYVLGFVYRMQGRLDDSRKAFEISLDYEPHRKLTYRHLFDAYTSEDHFDDAKGIIDRYARNFPGDTMERLSYRAVLELHQRKPESALATAEQLIRLDPRQAESYLVKGSALLMMDEFAAAENAFDTARTLSPGLVGRIERLTTLKPQPAPDEQPDNATDAPETVEP